MIGRNVTGLFRHFRVGPARLGMASCFLCACLWLLVGFPAGVSAQETVPPVRPGDALWSFSDNCADNIPHPGTIVLYVNDVTRVIPYTEYPLPFTVSTGSVGGVQCRRLVPVVAVYEYYRDSKGNYVDKEQARFIQIEGRDMEDNTFTADGVNDHVDGDGGAADASPAAGEHVIVMYENNMFKEILKASDFPEHMRCREVQTMLNGEVVTQKIPVARIEVLISGAGGKLTTADKAVRITIVEYAEDGSVLARTTLKKRQGD